MEAHHKDGPWEDGGGLGVLDDGQLGFFFLGSEEGLPAGRVTKGRYA